MIRMMSVLVVFAAVTSSRVSSKTYTFGDMPTHTATLLPKAVGVNVTTIDALETRSSSGEEYVASVTSRILDNDTEGSGTEDDSSGSVDAVGRPTSSSSSSSAVFTVGGKIKATSTIQSTYTNWVGTALDTSSTTACYREAHIAKNCPLGFNSRLGTCWAQCPYSYPVECGLECIRQNDDCALAVVSKISVVAQSALSFATLGLYGDFKLLAKGIQVAVKCTRDMIGLAKSLAKYIRSIKVSDPQTSQAKVLAILYQSDNVIFDLPVAVADCLGIKVDDSVKFAKRVLSTTELTLKEVMANSDSIVSSWDSFTAFMENITLGDSLTSLNETDITSLKSALESNSTCGYDMKRLLDRTWMTAVAMRRHDPSISEDGIRFAMSKSSLVLNDIPTVTNNCMDELIAESDESTAYATRDMLRKTFGGIVDDLVSSGTSSNGTFLTAEEYAFKVADKAATFYAVWDLWGVASTISEYLQPICGPTAYIGEIDDGNAKKALGMSIVQDAFNSSDGTWTKVGDGSVTITFKSADTEDVTVNIKSGGDKIDEVDVPAGKTVTWKSNVTTLGGKTLYLDRWRPGFLGLPGTGGGSLLLWVPRSTQGGNLQLTAVLNMTTRGNVHGLDELGQEVLWSSRGQQVMMQWEKQYMELCVEALGIQPSDRVLEIGFGLAYSASHIQTFRPRSHTIIECDQETLQRAGQFAAAHSGVEIVAGTWQKQLPTLGQFDCVFFDDYPLPELESGDLHTSEGGGSGRRSRWHDFLDVVLKHCANGARVSGYLARKVDLQRPGCRVAVTEAQVGVPENCNYFPHKTALVPVITVVDSAAAAGGAGVEKESLALPRSSKRFKRAFENAGRPGLAQPATFSRERSQIAGIREFLLAHEMGALSYDQSGNFDEGGEDSAANGGTTSLEHAQRDDCNNSTRSSHYSDEQSRREFLSALKSRAAASKQKLR